LIKAISEKASFKSSRVILFALRFIPGVDDKCDFNMQVSGEFKAIWKVSGYV
jgi:hypothetical protein